MAEFSIAFKPRVEGPNVELNPVTNEMESCWTIPFTQFILPDGRRKPNPYLCFDEDVSKKAQLILDAGFDFEIEVLSTGAVHGTITMNACNNYEGDNASFISPNGPAVVDKINGMIQDFEIPPSLLTKEGA